MSVEGVTNGRRWFWNSKEQRQGSGAGILCPRAVPRTQGGKHTRKSYPALAPLATGDVNARCGIPTQNSRPGRPGAVVWGSGTCQCRGFPHMPGLGQSSPRCPWILICCSYPQLQELRAQPSGGPATPLPSDKRPGKYCLCVFKCDLCRMPASIGGYWFTHFWGSFKS